MITLTAGVTLLVPAWDPIGVGRSVASAIPG
ncbi:MAG: hypothetical protein QOG82_2051 [Actinomycetota bacterium]|jgi:hypothetical protein|nr:hypothetical protein [Actinomycetota bacterium]